MVKRGFWLNLIENLWAKKPVLWMSGVRRAGKTSLCESIKVILSYDCELPSVRRALSDPEAFLKAHKGKRILLDEIHRLENPSEILKLAADHFKGTKVIATGSTILGASAKFKDTLAGRKAEPWLTPMLMADLAVLEATFVAHVVRPFSKHKATEIVSAPKLYAFDTGFMAFQKGWKTVTPEDKGILWEHLVLNEMHGRWQRRDIQYWRDKGRREVDFVVAHDVVEPYEKEMGGIRIRFVGLGGLISEALA